MSKMNGTVKLGNIVPGSRKTVFYRESDQKIFYGTNDQGQSVHKFVSSFQDKGIRRKIRKTLSSMGYKMLAAISVS